MGKALPYGEGASKECKKARAGIRGVHEREEGWCIWAVRMKWTGGAACGEYGQPRHRHQRDRAAALIARDERKKGKKEARRAAVSHAGIGKRRGGAKGGPGKLSVVRGPAPGGGGRLSTTHEGQVEVRTGSSRF